uniref:Secreted protein n=1 Tax=Timema genevievae TaxID=629358 RepID=A0A7R9KB08_TIMGE|nr:unnamed protein product [Timema genevievae]
MKQGLVSKLLLVLVRFCDFERSGAWLRPGQLGPEWANRQNEDSDSEFHGRLRVEWAWSHRTASQSWKICWEDP